MASDSQSPGIFNRIASGVGQILPYALPAALGAAFGGVGGAAAGVGMGAESLQEQQNRQELMQQRQADTAMEWARLGIEQQKAQLAAESNTDFHDWVKSQPADQRKELLALPPEARGPVLLTQMQQRKWDLTLKTMQDHPDFASALGLSPDALQAFASMGPNGQHLFDQYVVARQRGNLEQQRLLMQQLYEQARLNQGDQRLKIEQQRADTESARAKEGGKPASRATQQMKALSALATFNRLNPKPGFFSTSGQKKTWRDSATQALEAAGIDNSVAESTVDSTLGEPTSKDSASGTAVTDFLKKHGISG